MLLLPSNKIEKILKLQVVGSTRAGPAHICLMQQEQFPACSTLYQVDSYSLSAK